MGKTSVVSFAVAPDDHAVLRLLADMRGESVSQLCHSAVMRELNVEDHKKRLSSFFAVDNQNSGQETDEYDVAD